MSQLTPGALACVAGAHEIDFAILSAWVSNGTFNTQAPTSWTSLVTAGITTIDATMSPCAVCDVKSAAYKRRVC